jgi:hypothetical protein
LETKGLVLSLGDMAKIEGGLRRLCRAGGEEVHHMGFTDWRELLGWWWRLEVIFIDCGWKLIGNDMVYELVGAEFKLGYISVRSGTIKSKSCLPRRILSFVA